MKRTILIACMLAAVASFAVAQDAAPLEGNALQSLTYAGFIGAVKEGRVKSVVIGDRGEITGTILIEDAEHFFTAARPKESSEDVLLLELLGEKGVEVTHGPQTPIPVAFVSIIGCISVAVPLVTIILLLMIMSKLKRIEQYQYDNAR